MKYAIDCLAGFSILHINRPTIHKQKETAAMNKLLFTLAALVIVLATEGAAKGMYDQKAKVAQFGIGIGGIGGFYGSSSLPVLSAGLDFGVHEFVSVGGVVGYSTSKFESPVFFVTPGNRGTYSWRYSYITIAARGSYHAPLEVKNTDLYGGVGLGYTIVSSKYEGPAQTGFIATGSSGSYMFFGIHVGGRYYFSPSFAAFAELGYGFGILNVGVALKI